jgi:hypothetical protein
MSKPNSREVLDLFGYVILSAPDFPEEDDTNTDVEIARLAEAVKRIWSDELSDEKRRWLALCLKEIGKVGQLFRLGDEQKGLELLQSAEGHFKNALAGTAMKTAFYVDESGEVAKVDAIDDEPTQKPN